jgi:hypothetical protein
MRGTLALAGVLLGLTLGLNQARDWFHLSPRLRPRELEIVVGSKGALLPAAELGSGTGRIAAAIRLGDRTLVPAGPHGILAAFVTPDFELRAERFFDLAHEPAATEALFDAVADAREGELAVFATRGEFRPAAAHREGFERVLDALGARERPECEAHASWALIALRDAQRWIPLAEGLSAESGVALAFVLSSDFERYADFDGDRVRVRASPRSELSLEEELPYAAELTDGVGLARRRSVGGQPLASLLVPSLVRAGAPAPGRLVWNDVELAPGAWFYALVGLADGSADAQGANAEVRIDGQRVDGRAVLTGAPWRPLLVDLRPFEGRRVSLELRVEPGTSPGPIDVLFGRPTLIRGYERSPLAR